MDKVVRIDSNKRAMHRLNISGERSTRPRHLAEILLTLQDVAVLFSTKMKKTKLAFIVLKWFDFERVFPGLTVGFL